MLSRFIGMKYSLERFTIMRCSLFIHNLLLIFLLIYALLKPVLVDVSRNYYGRVLILSVYDSDLQSLTHRGQLLRIVDV